MINTNKTIDFAIIDAHIHQWDPYHTPHPAHTLVKIFGDYPGVMDKLLRLVKPQPLIDTIGSTAHILAPYLPQDYAKDLQHYRVDSVVHIEANWHDHKGTGVVGETRWINSLPFAQYDIQLGAIVAAADPRDQQFKKILDLHQQVSPVFRGIRKMASYHQDKGIYRWCDQANLYRDKKFLTGFEELAKRHLSFDAWVYSSQLNDVIELAKQFPETAIVIDHLATPAGLFGPVGKTTGQIQQDRLSIFVHWKEHIARLAEHRNVYAKISGLMMPVLGHDYYRKGQHASVDKMIHLLSPLIDHAIQVFGIDRIIFASNYPMDKPNAKLVDIITAYLAMIRPYGDQALQAIFRQNAKRFYQMV
ncbi:hypothetical protein GCM10023206_31400 [Acinetobacter puyangensis]|uniref:Predicted metal-dependent hydrolase, TIM-barrel fold n=1 Tax=Acinetobacter puyangensis TaxID=1096779 RepID=A0A240E2U5_9GAMM|nr:amidohydrolase family protein [Acinetobacter puyangensis]SNX43094.1 Predicted metal-dependent hydrolase, TIM-barrel fold [Acinetobacter puyangensis]